MQLQVQVLHEHAAPFDTMTSRHLKPYWYNSTCCSPAHFHVAQLGHNTVLEKPQSNDNCTWLYENLQEVPALRQKPVRSSSLSWSTMLCLVWQRRSHWTAS